MHSSMHYEITTKLIQFLPRVYQILICIMRIFMHYEQVYCMYSRLPRGLYNAEAPRMTVSDQSTTAVKRQELARVVGMHGA
jgi:hypothetical protein